LYIQIISPPVVLIDKKIGVIALVVSGFALAGYSVILLVINAESCNDTKDYRLLTELIREECYERNGI
jgi:hypothetical protein